MKCDCCEKEVSANIKLRSTFNFSDGEFTKGWLLCYDCANDLNNYISRVKNKLIVKGN